MFKFAQKLTKANVDHYNNHPGRHSVIIGALSLGYVAVLGGIVKVCSDTKP